MTQAVIKWSKWISLTLLSLLCSLALFICVLLFTNPGLNLALWAAEKFVPQLKIESTSGALLPRFTLNHVQFKDDSLNVDLEASSITLAINASCLTEPSVCVDEVAIDGVSFVMPQLPPSSESQPEAETTTGTKVTAPLPIAVRRIALTNIDLDVLENKIRWDNFATGISFSGNRLRVAKTALEGMKVALAQKSVDEQEVIHEPVENTSATEFELPKIELPHIELPLQIELSRLDVRDFELTQQTPVIVHHLGLEMNAVGSDIDIQRLELDMPQLSAQATTKVSLSENYPLNLALEALVKDPVANGQTLQLDVSGSADDLNLNAVLGGLVEAQLDAKLNPLNTTLPFELNIQDASVQYPLSGTAEYQVSIDKLHTSGSLKQYQLDLATKVKGKQLPDLELSLQGEGTQSQIELSKVALNTLGGSVSGDIMANWQTPINWAANLKLSHIQPGLQWQEAEGDISGELSTSGQLTEQGGWVVELPKLDIDGVLRNYPLNIEGSLIASDRLGDGSINASTPRLALSHGPNTVTAKGSLNQEWNMDLALNLPDFIKTVPDLNGSASGSVFLRGSLKQPTLDLDLTVDDIDWAQQAQVASLTLKGSATPLPEPKANLSLQVKAARYQEQVIDHIKLTFSGSKQQHSANLDVSSNIASTSLAISGALEEKPDISWQGALERMSLTSEQGEWVLERSTELGFVMATKQVSVAAHCWLQAESSICLDNNISVGEVGEAAVSVNNFNIDQLKQYIPQQTEVIAKVDATAWAKWAPNQTPSVKASVILPKGSVTQQVERPLTLGWETIQINANLADSKLDASWLLDVIDNGDISGNMTIPDVQAEDKLIDGQFTLGRFNLDFLAPIIGEYSKLGSEITADLKLAGPAMQPEVEGQLKVDNILLRGDISPLQVESGEVVVDFAGYDADLTAQIHTPDGKLEMTGDANWADLKDWRTNLRVFADELRVEVPPMVKVKVQPDMTISATPSYAKVEGDISLPWGRIVVEELPPSAVSVSKDQVILDKDLQPVDDESSVPLAIETDININIGDDFKLLAFGLEGGLIGKLNVTQKDKGPFITGEINIQDGSYQSFGQDLIISEGKILMNGPADQPYVQITAIRNPDNTQDDVTAGVKVTGPANEPTVTIFSEPAMAQANALSYLLRGQDIDGESGGNSMTTTLIGLSLAKSGRVVGEIGEAFGVQDLQLDTAGSGDDSQVTVSGYILPGLQVKYGVGIFDSVGEFTVRYRLMQDLYVEAISGVDSAVDLLYQFEFN